ncbi:MAG: phosphoglycolate phosphatase [Paracoccaceae bacterium]
MKVIFDLDGTLVDSAVDIQAAVNAMLAGEGQPPMDRAQVQSYVGNGLPRLVERVMAARGMDIARHLALTKAVLAHYANGPKLTRCYPGVVAALQALRASGHVLGLCTNKPERAALGVLRDLDLAGFFKSVVGGDRLLVNKPDPAPLHLCLHELGGGNAVFVGDSEVDAETAVAAGLPFLLYTEGYRKGPVESLPHRAAFADYAALPGLIAG